jgi:hypothetical protein
MGGHPANGIESQLPKEKYPMASYGKYVMMGVSTLLLPLAKKGLQKLIDRRIKGSKDHAAPKEAEVSMPNSRFPGRETG